MKLKATNEYHSTAISPRLPSNFIELGYGLQVEGMAAEMFFNRSFEPFYPYRLINKLWYDLLDDENDFTSRCETDWRVFDWYHSSYEHNAWFAFPGVGGYQEIKDDSTFVIGRSPSADVRIRMVEGGNHGTHAMEVVNNSSAPGGLAQDGKYFFPGVVCRFRGMIRTAGNPPAGRSFPVKAALYREGDTSDPGAAPVCVAELGIVRPEYAEFRCGLSAPEEGRYTFVLLLPPGGAVECDDFSLMPEDAKGAFKKSAVETGKYVAPGVIRWPGGCFASFYNWREGVGKNRRPSYSYFWGGYQYNDVGTDELAAYAEELGAESMICVNVYHPFKRYFEYVPPESLDGDPDDRSLTGALHDRDLPEFTDKEKGAAEAAAWVEYCNGGPDTEGGRARAANGHPEPYNVKYWEMDNEIHRWYRPDEYAGACSLYSKAMKAVDPSIKIGLISYCYGEAALPGMLEICGRDVDFLADRGFAEDELERKLAIIMEYNAKNGTDIKYCNTEWLPLNGADVYNMVPRSETRRNKCFMFSKWTYALDAAATLMMWQRHGDVVDFVNFNNLANTHSQSAIETAKEGGYVTAAGMMLHRFAVTRAYRTLKLENYHPERDDAVSVQLSADRTGKALVLNVLNRSSDDGEVVIDLGPFSAADGKYGGVILSAPEMLSMNTLTDRPVREIEGSVTIKAGNVAAPAPRLSFAEYVIELTEPLQAF